MNNIAIRTHRFRNLKSGRPRLQEGNMILTVKLIAEDKEEMPLDFTFTKVDDNWKIDRIATVNANVKS